MTKFHEIRKEFQDTLSNKQQQAASLAHWISIVISVCLLGPYSEVFFSFLFFLLDILLFILNSAFYFSL